ncbi:hypothetical protein [Nonomuraea zeae]|uniref:hypothetical protein n=1 Tax=Nonomuraea zeae TaxID=1642303 RepID=UPI00197D87C2|nr:hypothetical protein [Nonomuraea zeae]
MASAASPSCDGCGTRTSACCPTYASAEVSADPGACHRSLIARRLTERHHVTIEHLRPL